MSSPSRPTSAPSESSAAAAARAVFDRQSQHYSSTTGDSQDDNTSDDSASATTLQDDPVPVSTQQPASQPAVKKPLSQIPVVPDYLEYNSKDPKAPWNEHKILYATKDIPQYTRILVEKPIITLRVWHVRNKKAEQIANLLVQQYNQLSNEDKVWIDNLRPAAIPLIDDLRQLIDAILPAVELLRYKEDRTDEEDHQLRLLVAHVSPMCDKWRTASRILGSTIHWEDASDASELADLPNNASVQGLYKTASYIRNSCLPNCFVHPNHREGHLTIHTTHAVAAGEELTYPFIGRDTFYRPAYVRQQAFSQAPFQSCRCRACAPPDLSNVVFLAEQDEQRNKNLYHTQVIHNYMARADKFGSEENAALDRADPDWTPPLTDVQLRDAEKFVSDLVAGLQRAGCNDVTVAAWYERFALEILCRAERAMEAYKWGCRAERLLRGVIGDDNPSYTDFKRRLEEVKGCAEVEMREKGRVE
ncbi:hypothetical protein CC80DRAFT_500120 [Byssothecium circinans]|uniref:SET domain-containing protein n=1 Tax=Byssothecium circinans TaxID=147558 RepID=A0A6A5U9A9_9PLEO|nr:hypothetical protein CC80DRAFT_500120 [Byssothecium circinans]